MMHGTGISHGAISVMNAIPFGVGATIGIDLKTEAVFDSDNKVTIDLIDRPGLSTKLAETCVLRTREAMGEDTDRGYHLTVKTQIPPSMGLKSSSSVCNAIILAVLDAYEMEMDDDDMVRLGVECAIECGVTVTGAFDDACGCHFGGLVMTNNHINDILYRGDVPKYDVVLCIPDRMIEKKDVPVEKYKELTAEYMFMASLIKKDYTFVMTENGKHIAKIIGDEDDLAGKAMKNGAIAAGISGTGPATAIIAKKGDGERIASLMGCKTILTTTR